MKNLTEVLKEVPDRYIADLFLDSILDAPVKDDMRLMAYPFFSLSKVPRFDPIVYIDQNTNQTIRVTAGERGIATIYDKDVIMYAVSLVVDQMNKGLAVDRTIQFNAYDLLKLTHRGTGGASYERLFDAMFRLRSTTITTTIDSGAKQDTRGFGWIDSFKIVTNSTKRGRVVMGAVEITLSDWMWRALQNYKTKVLTINRDYFKLTKGLERKLYELARKHCGNQPTWNIGLRKLAERCGSQVELRQFKYQLKAIIRDNQLPDYNINLAFDKANKDEYAKTFDKERLWRWGGNDKIVICFSRRLPAS